MSKEIKFSVGAVTLAYFRIFSADGTLVWTTSMTAVSGVSDATFGGSTGRLAATAVQTSNSTSTGNYTADWPGGLSTAAEYEVKGFATTPVPGADVANVRGYWDGTTFWPRQVRAGTAANITSDGNTISQSQLSAIGSPMQAGSTVVLTDASLTTAKLGTFALAKSTNITGFNDIAASAVWALTDGIESGVTPKQAMQRIGATTAGKISGAGSGVEIFKGLDGTTTRVTVTVDDSGNRSNVAYA